MRRKVYVFFLLLVSMSSLGQDDLLTMLENNEETLTFATFKSSKIINLETIEQPAEAELDFIICHRFGTLNSGIENLYGIDYGNVRMIFNYGLTDNVTLGLARSSTYKVIDGSLKTKLINQGKNNFPLTISTYSIISFDTLTALFSNKKKYADNFSYTNQLLLARKINSELSFQISPSITYYNFPSPFLELSRIMYSLGIGGRYKLNKSVSINYEWIPIIKSGDNIIHPIKNENHINSFSFGCDIETGGHVFQLFLSNSTAMFERGFINENVENWSDGGIHFGFNISRSFNF